MATPEPVRDDFSRYLRELERRLAVVEQRSPLANTGMSVPGPGVVQVDGALDVVGTETVDGSLTVGGSLTVSGAAAITGTLSLPAGIIDNAALANPISASAANPAATGFGLTTSWAILATIDMTVPAGFTVALIHLTGGVFCFNPNATGGADGTGTDAWNVSVATSPGYGSYVYMQGVSGNGGFASAHADVAFRLAGLTPGTVIAVRVWGCSSYQTIAANASNHASASASMLWLRS